MYSEYSCCFCQDLTQPSADPKPCGILSASGRVPGLRLWEPAEHGDCDSFGLELREALHRNLGGFGPDDGEESIVYRLTGRDRASCTKGKEEAEIE